MSGFLTKEAIKGRASSIKVELVDVPEWDGFVYVREMTARARDIFEDSMFGFDPSAGKLEAKTTHNRRSLFVVLTACDADGKPIFDECDIGWLGEKQFKAVNRIYTAASKLNGFSTDDSEKNAEAPAADSSLS